MGSSSKLEILGPMENRRYADYITDIHNSGQSLLGIIDSILDLARIEANDEIRNEEACDISELFRTVDSISRSETLRKRILMRSDVQAGLPDLWADPVMLHRIFANIISNAVKFTPPDGTIEMRALLVKGNRLAIEVIDTGPGIDREASETLFHPFEQGAYDAGVANNERGLGLGLSISKRYADLHDANLVLENRDEGGLRVRLTFPASRVLSGASLAN